MQHKFLCSLPNSRPRGGHRIMCDDDSDFRYLQTRQHYRLFEQLLRKHRNHHTWGFPEFRSRYGGRFGWKKRSRGGRRGDVYTSPLHLLGAGTDKQNIWLCSVQFRMLSIGRYAAQIRFLSASMKRRERQKIMNGIFRECLGMSE